MIYQGFECNLYHKEYEITACKFLRHSLWKDISEKEDIHW